MVRQLTILWSCAALVVAVMAPGAWAAPLGTGFTYQGELLESGSPYSGTADFRLRLWDMAAGGSQVSGTITRGCVNVQNGLFTLQDLDFGVDVFDGQNVYLEIHVRTPCATGTYVTLTPRQRVAPTPYALQTRGLFVDAGLNVGIGTTTPAERLDVAGNVQVTDGDGDPAVILRPSASGTANDIQLYRDGELASRYDSVSEGTQLRMLNTMTGLTVLAGGVSVADDSGFWEVYGHNGSRTVWLDADNDQDPNNGILSGALQIRSTGTGGTGGELNVQNNDGAQTVQILGGASGAGSTMTFTNGAAAPVDTITMFGDSGDGGLIQMRNSADLVTVNIDADSGDGALITLENDASSTRLTLDGDNADGGAVTVNAADGSSTIFLDGQGDNDGGNVSVRNNISEETIQLRGDNGNNCSRITLFDREGSNNFASMTLDAVDPAGTGSELLMYDNEGDTATIELNGDNAAGGAATGELSIYETDGSLAMRFLSNTLTLYNGSGTATITWNRATGAKSGVVETEGYGPRLVYCTESPEIWFEDFGSGQLSGGEAHIPLDPVFLESVTIDEQHPLKVFVTLTDDCRGVYVRKGLDSFSVYELDGGTSDATFDYRIVAKRRGLEDVRFEPFPAKDELEADAMAPAVPSTANDAPQDIPDETPDEPSRPLRRSTGSDTGGVAARE